MLDMDPYVEVAALNGPDEEIPRLEAILRAAWDVLPHEARALHRADGWVASTYAVAAGRRGAGTGGATAEAMIEAAAAHERRLGARHGADAARFERVSDLNCFILAAGQLFDDRCAAAFRDRPEIRALDVDPDAEADAGTAPVPGP